jgi:uncharacterized protein
MNPNAFRNRYGPWAVIAGASEGLGAAYARECAGRGLNVILVARSRGKLDVLQKAIAAQYGVECRTTALDLAQGDAAEILDKSTSEMDVGLLVYNAALSLIGPFASFSEAQHRNTLATNCVSPALCAYRFGKRLANRGKGGILLMSSLAGLQGSPNIAHYAATKAYLLTLAQGLASEYASADVDILACCAGSTATPGFARASGSAEPSFLVMRPETVARKALDHLHKRGVYVPGFFNAASAFVLSRLLPRRAAVAILSQSTSKLAGNLTPVGAP